MRLHFTAVASALLALSHAHGQASFGTAPEPITGAMLERWFAELDLSQPQRQAVDQLHATYLQNFAEIREDEIEEVVSRGGIFGAIFGGGDVGKVFREIDQLIDEVEDVDEIFLDQIEPILTPNQMLILERLDARRDRVRRSGGPLSLLGRANPAGLADLSALIPLDRMADPELSTILNEYETELADRFERLERSAKNAFNTFAETLADLRESSDDRRAIFQEMQNVMADASLPVIREATSVSRLHRETLPQLEIALGKEAGDELRANWLDTCYSEVGREENRVRRRFLSALQLADLDGETKSLVKATWSDWREKLRSVAKPMLDAVDATRAEASLITFGRSRGRGGGIPDTLEDQQENIAERAIEELVMLIGESRYEKLNDRNKSADGRRRRDPRMQGPRTKSTLKVKSGTTPTSRLFEMAIPAEGPDGFLAAPLSLAALLDGIAFVRPSADESVFSTVKTFHESYQLDWNAEVTEELQRIIETRATQWKWDRKSGLEGPTNSEIGELSMARRTLAETQARLDNDLFELLNAVVVESAEERSRLNVLKGVRNRQRLAARGLAASGTDRILSGLNLPRANPSDAIAMLIVRQPKLAATAELNFGAALTNIFQMRWEAKLEAVDAGQRAITKVLAESGEPADRRIWGAIGTALNEVSQSKVSDLREYDEDVRDQNDKVIRSVTKSLAPEMAESLRRDLAKLTRPEVWIDKESPEAALLRASSLEAISPGVREQIADLLESWREIWNPTSLEMSEMMDRHETDKPVDGRPSWVNRMEQQRELDAIRFRRTEANQRALRGLRDLLNPMQLSEVGVLVSDG